MPNELATSAAKSPALLAYIAALNILDADALLSTGKVRSRLDPAITAKKGIERHHIFPRSYLRSVLKIADNKEINQIANMALVEWADNIAISDDAPTKYWPEQVAARPCQPKNSDDKVIGTRYLTTGNAFHTRTSWRHVENSWVRWCGTVIFNSRSMHTRPRTRHQPPRP